MAIKLTNGLDRSNVAVLSVERWEGAKARKRALKLMGKGYGSILLVACFAIFVHPLILPTIASLFLAFVSSPFLYFYLSDQKATIHSAEGECPSCGKTGHFKPYLWRNLAPRMTLLCSECGQSCYAELIT